MDVKVYLSHGGGVNSWALYLWLIEQSEKPGVDFEAVFVDHGTDWPETYEYMDMMIARGYPVTVLKPNNKYGSTVEERCFRRRIIPYKGKRWCTKEYKVDVLKAYYKTPCIELIGIDAEEAHRAKHLVGKIGVEQDFPLIAAGINRQGCIEIIKRHGLPIPPKSGCYICPFQSRAQWIELKRKHPELFCKAMKLEKLCNERRAAAGKSSVYFRDIPLEVLVQPKDNRGHLAKPGQGMLFDPDHDRPPCRCGL